MTLKIAEAVHDEYGRYNGGKKGDSTGDEFRIRSLYHYQYGGWNTYYRHPEKQVRKLINDMAKSAANNNKIGYSMDASAKKSFEDQSLGSRYGFWRLLRNVRHPRYVKKKCNTDCSASVYAIVEAALSEYYNTSYHLAYRNGTKVGSRDAYTGSIARDMKYWGFDEKNIGRAYADAKYLKSHCKAGDILLNKKHHVGIIVDV